MIHHSAMAWGPKPNLLAQLITTLYSTPLLLSIFKQMLLSKANWMQIQVIKEQGWLIIFLKDAYRLGFGQLEPESNAFQLAVEHPHPYTTLCTWAVCKLPQLRNSCSVHQVIILWIRRPNSSPSLSLPVCSVICLAYIPVISLLCDSHSSCTQS